ncbi:hypothetical protein ACVOMV_34725 [Mesorhizobium atlanticum]
MESRWLEDFLSLVDTREFLPISRGAIHNSNRLSADVSRCLEDWVGAKLFDRDHPNRSVRRPRANGSGLSPRRILRRLLQGREDARRVGETSANLIRFSATHSLSLTFFPSWIRSIEAKTHTFNIRLDSCQFNDCMQSLIKGESHFAISHAHPQVRG